MDYTDQEFKHAAMFLDGQRITLSEREDALVAELSGEEQIVEPLLDTAAPAEEVAQKATRTLLLTAKSLAKKLRLRHAVFTGYGLAAAAAILLATLGLYLNSPINDKPASAGPVATHVPTEVILAGLDAQDDANPLNIEADLIQSQIDGQMAEIDIPASSVELDSEDVDEFLQIFMDIQPPVLINS